MLLFVLLQAASPPEPLHLTCLGQGTAREADYSNFSDQVSVRLFDGENSIQIPRIMLPFLHGGKDGWFKLRNLTVDSRTIKAKVSISPIEHPNVLIDRLTGILTIAGDVGQFTGRCEVMDKTAPPKF